jgi:hypothetical protein
MKKINVITKKLLLIVVVISSVFAFANAQDSTKENKALSIENGIKNKHFVFVAQNVQPTTGRFRQLTSYYDLKVANDTLQSSLPYFGRAYAPPVNPSEGGYDFASTKFDYEVKERKKGGWEIIAKPSDRHNGERFFLTVSQSGDATLQVTSNNRQPISFHGYLKER